MSWLEGRVGVVTGASRGIGAATAMELARAGVHVVIGARTTGDLDAIAEKIRAEGFDATAVTCDVSREPDVESLFAAAEAIAPPTVVVSAAGVLERALLEETSSGDWRRTLDVNLTGTFLVGRRAFAAMRAAGGGRIVTIASLSGVYATEKFPGLAAYNVSKYGVVGLTEAIAVEGVEHGISAVCISPGAVDTEMLRRAAPHLNPGLGPHDVGLLIVGLLNGEFDAMSGANIPLFSNR
jgi:NAD(P)-dependent dehydrogenase (short-subunit alcohol dehydrogenase family)